MINKKYINTVTFFQIYSLLTVILYGYFFFAQQILKHISPYYLPVSLILAWQGLFIIFSVLFSYRFTKFFSILLLICNAWVFYFMFAYHIPVDKIMFMNALQTDSGEASEFLNLTMASFLICLGIIPALIIQYKIIIRRSPIKKIVRSLVLSLLIILVLSGLTYRPTDYFLRQFKYLQTYLPPLNYITGGIQTLKQQLTPKPPLQSISQKIKPIPVNGKPNLIIFIMGESSRAASFSLNGYHRPTNQALTPYLKDIIYYPNVQTCGTSTAVSVPCIFLPYPQKQYHTGNEVYTENILDIFKKAGYHIRWLDNDGGCKNVCTRVFYEEPCQHKTCSDDLLLKNLKQKITSQKNNQLIVLHTRGSHGPNYHLRYDTTNDIYAPICDKNDLWNCRTDELINVYDNTIHYVSQFIAQTIKILQQVQKDYNPILIYTSDHGESLGENGIYLHSAPYATAPREQKEVPLLIWMPQQNNYRLNKTCLRNKARNNRYSHDNIFHSLLGLSKIYGSHYQSELDIFAGCRK